MGSLQALTVAIFIFMHNNALIVYKTTHESHLNSHQPALPGFSPAKEKHEVF